MGETNRPRGYFGIGVYNIKTEMNLGTLWRSAQNFGASFIFTIGRRYKRQASDTTRAQRHVPLYEYLTLEDFYEHMPKDCMLVCIEQTDDAKKLRDFPHPERAVYLLGAEDYGLPEKIMKGHSIVYIDTPYCLNVAVAGSIIMYDRSVKNK